LSVLVAGSRLSLLRRFALLLAVVVLALAARVAGADAYNYVYTANGAAWGVQDAAAPRVDTGSIRDITGNALRGYGGIRVSVSTDPLRNGDLMRGFGLKLEPPNRFGSTDAVDMGGVAVWRKLYFSYAGNWGRWLDFFENTTDEPIEVKAIFGGQTGIGSTTGTTDSHVAATSSGDTTVTPEDSWLENRVGTEPTVSTSGPSGIVLGSPVPFAGAMTRTANFLVEPFSNPPAPSGHEGDFVGYQNTFTLQPGEVKALAHFVVVGLAETAGGTGAAAPGFQLAAVKKTTEELAAQPSFGDLTKAEICALANWNLATIAIPAFNPTTDCAKGTKPVAPPLAPPTPTTTGSKYNVVGKTIADLRADMESGVTTSQEITRAYLDRIAAYNGGPFGFNALDYVDPTAMAQAKAADEARAAGASGPLLGIPIVVKDLYDTKDMPTTNGSLVFQGYQSPDEATQVARLREAGAVILGKSSLEEYAQSGYYSDSAYGQVWNAFDTSKSSIASSGGTAVATATSLAAAGLGTQTGDSLYGPSSAASLWTLRGTDGMASSYGVMPLTWLQDYPGTIAQSASDLADMLNVTTGTDPKDPITVEADANAHRPANWRTSLDPNALKGKRIGYYESAFEDPFGTTGTVKPERESLKYFEEAGATLVKISGGPTLPSYNSFGDRNFAGWQFWIESHPNSPYSDPREIIASPLRLPYRRLTGYTGTGMMTAEQIAGYKAARAQAKQAVAEWLENPPSPETTTGAPSPGPLDAVVYPGLRSVISLNDGGSSSFGRGDPPSNNAGTPTVAFPAGTTEDGEPFDLQIIGKAWSDPQLLSYAYAFNEVAHGQMHTHSAPALTYVPDAAPPVITEPAPAERPVTGPPAAGGAPQPERILRHAKFVGGHRIAVDGKGVVTVRVRCASESASKCRVAVVLRSGGKVVAHAAPTVAADRTVVVHLRLTPAARRRLNGKHAIAAVVQTTVHDATGKRTATRPVRLVMKGR
jgi:amidase